MESSVSKDGARPRVLKAEAWLLPGIILVTFAIYALSPVTTSTDSAWTFHLAASILREHNIDLDEYRGLMDLQLDYRLRIVGGHVYSYYPIATPLLVTPAVWLTNAVYPLFYRTDFYTYLQEHAPDTRTAKLEKVIASGIAALAAALVYIIARRELGVRGSLVITSIFALSTSMWSTASRALWQHGPSALFLSAALFLLLLSHERPGLFLWIGMLLGYSYLIRPTNSLSVAFIGLYVLLNRRRDLWLYVLGVVLILVPYMFQNWITYRNIFPSYSYQLFERLASPSVFTEALAGTLISPARGLLVFSPVLLFALYGMFLRLHNEFSTANISCYLAGIVILHWITTSLFEDWGGAWSIGPRYFVDILPYLVYFLIPVLAGARFASAGWRTAFATVVVLSALIQLHCATSIYPFMWNGKPRALVEAPERKWDWGDLQFLRGFCAGNPLEGRAPACWFERNG
jgi:hypothetical protein